MRSEPVGDWRHGGVFGSPPPTEAVDARPSLSLPATQTERSTVFPQAQSPAYRQQVPSSSLRHRSYSRTATRFERRRYKLRIAGFAQQSRSFLFRSDRSSDLRRDSCQISTSLRRILGTTRFFGKPVDHFREDLPFGQGDDINANVLLFE